MITLGVDLSGITLNTGTVSTATELANSKQEEKSVSFVFERVSVAQLALSSQPSLCISPLVLKLEA